MRAMIAERAAKMADELATKARILASQEQGRQFRDSSAWVCLYSVIAMLLMSLIYRILNWLRRRFPFIGRHLHQETLDGILAFGLFGSGFVAFCSFFCMSQW